MRGGSKSVPNKNLRYLNGKPLLAYTIEQALLSNLFEHVVVSTDSENIAKEAKKYGAEVWFLRPAELATDFTPKLPAIRHALKEAEEYYNCQYDVLVDLDATSPLRLPEDIINAYKQFIDENADNLISGSLARKNPYFSMVEIIDGRVGLVKTLNSSVYRRQDAPLVYDMNASIYIWKRRVLLKSDTLFLRKTSLYIMPEDRSIDIDTENDWAFVEYLISKDNT